MAVAWDPPCPLIPTCNSKDAHVACSLFFVLSSCVSDPAACDSCWRLANTSLLDGQCSFAAGLTQLCLAPCRFRGICPRLSAAGYSTRTSADSTRPASLAKGLLTLDCAVVILTEVIEGCETARHTVQIVFVWLYISMRLGWHGCFNCFNPRSLPLC